MKRFFLSFWLFLMAVMVVAQDSIPGGDTPTGDDTNWVVVIIGAVIAVAEIVMRSVPKESLKGLIGLLIDVLKNISDYLNNKGK